MPVLILLLRVIGILLLVRVVGRFVAGLLRGLRDDSPARPRVEGDLVRDRICNTFVPRDRALKALVAGHEEHFCSASCRDRALAGTRTA
ncbi:MAG TPA: hypothetical protein VJU18_05520 [Vicinamibacteria bacterium]|nr:hypothetical protein [Vicinamibacteria bacterium]